MVSIMVLTWLFTPESLIVVSKASGLSGYGVLVQLPVVFAAILAASFVLYNPALAKMGYKDAFESLSAYLGKTGAISTLILGRVPLLLFGSTGMLVSAGFAFNEIFVYWFPNFLFASLLLAVIAIIQLCGERVALFFQILFVAVAAFFLSSLLFLGLIGGPGGSSAVSVSEATISWQGFSLLFLCFIGFDFYRGGIFSRTQYLFIVGGTALLLIWAVMSLYYLEQDTLINSMISYMKLARGAAGDTGRYIMGIGLISGVVAGVNGLFIVSQRAVLHMARKSTAGTKRKIGWGGVIIFAIAIEAMMMTGMAGDDLLETQLRATILLWLFHVGLRLGISGLILSRVNFLYLPGTGILTVLFWGIMAYLGWISLQTQYLMMFTGITVLATVILVFAWQMMISRRYAEN